MAIKKHQEKEEDFIYFKINKNDVCKFISYNERIKNLLSDNKSVPIKYYNRMLNLILPKGKDSEDYYDNVVDVMTKDIVGYLSNHSHKNHYLFSVRKRENVEDIPNEDGTKNIEVKTVTYSFEKMVRIAVIDGVYTFVNSKNRNKDEVIISSYKSIIDYIYKDGKNISKVITHHGASVIAGLIAMQFDDFSNFFDDKEINNTELYNKVKHQTNPQKPIHWITKKKRK